MLSIRKLTEYMKKPVRPGTVSIKKLTSLNRLVSKGYQPLSRFQKLRQTGLVFPKSTPSKIVFISNTHGNGFRNEQDYDFPLSIPIQKMKEQIDKVCYQRWKEYKEFLELDSFLESQNATKILLAIGLTVIGILFISTIGNIQIESMTDILLLISCLIMLACLISSMIIFSKKSPEFDFDSVIISAIKNKLSIINLIEKEVTLNEPRFQWSCNKDCTWIAIELFDQVAQ